jgi:MoxR-like ATPase
MTQGGPEPAPAPGRAGTAPRAPADVAEMFRRVAEGIGHDIVGYDDVVRALMIALVAEGHVLIEGMPGIAKTRLVRAFSQTLQLAFRRIQFTPDMLPTDILGAMVLNPKDQGFVFRPGPIFANVILADEINRAPPKVQSALLEAMQERQVTVEGVSHALPSPFIVIATENPIEHEGTYPLPEAELDRFLFRWIMGYPSSEDEVRILKTRSQSSDATVATPVVTPSDIARLQELRRGVFVHEDLYAYVAALVRQTRQDSRLLVGASPRAGVQFLMAAQAAALLDGRSFVIPDDVRELVFAVFNHRVMVRPEVLSQSLSLGKVSGATALLAQLLAHDTEAVAVPR